jgi:hypothetical protein
MSVRSTASMNLDNEEPVGLRRITRSERAMRQLLAKYTRHLEATDYDTDNERYADLSMMSDLLTWCLGEPVNTLDTIDPDLWSS